MALQEEREALTRRIRAQLQNEKRRLDQAEVGTLLRLGDGVARASGLDHCVAGELIELPNGGWGMALNLEEDEVSLALLGSEAGLMAGSEVRRTGRVVCVPAGEALLGRVVDALGAPVDGKGPIAAATELPIEAPAPGILDRERVSVPLQTGVKAIDALVPIGRGQRELIIGDRQTGKTALAVDTILAQQGQNVICIYVAIGQKRSSVARLAAELSAAGAMQYTFIVSATASEGASLQYIAPYAGCAMGEYFMRRGRDVLIVYDDLSRHAVAYRTLSLLLRRPPGREAYPGDVFYLHARLLERAARLKPELGGGSMTALPIIETQAGDVAAYIPTNVISITDGQIFLSAELFRSGVRPAVDPGISVSRVGGSAQAPAMKRVAGSLRLQYSRYRELQRFAQFGAELDPGTRRELEQGARIVEVLRQGRGLPQSLPQMVCILFAVSRGLLDDVPPEQILRLEAALHPWLERHEALLLRRIRETGKLSAEDEQKLEAALRSFLEEAPWRA